MAPRRTIGLYLITAGGVAWLLASFLGGGEARSLLGLLLVAAAPVLVLRSATVAAGAAGLVGMTLFWWPGLGILVSPAGWAAHLFLLACAALAVLGFTRARDSQIMRVPFFVIALAVGTWFALDFTPAAMRWHLGNALVLVGAMLVAGSTWASSGEGSTASDAAQA